MAESTTTPTKVSFSVLSLSFVAAVVSVLVLCQVVGADKGTMPIVAAGVGALVFVSLFTGVLWQRQKS